MKNRKTWFDYFNIILMCLLSLVTLYPIIYIFFNSISSAYGISSGITRYMPYGINLDAYKMAFENKELGGAYLNSIIYTVLGTLIHIIVVSIISYPLIFKNFKLNKYISIFYVVSMVVTAGMIPTYIVYSSLGFIDSLWVMVLPNAVSVYAVMIFRTYFKINGYELIEAAYLDGANDFSVLFRILIPISKPIISTFALFKIVAIWNEFFTPLLYFNDSSKFPLTIILRKLLIEVSMKTMRNMKITDMDSVGQLGPAFQAVNGATIMITILPIIAIYPFIQKYFVKGIMIGSLKG